MEMLIALLTWNAHVKDVEQIHYKYDVDLKTEAIMLFHQFIQTFMFVGAFFEPELHFWYCYIVALLRVNFGDCIISMYQKKWIGYSQADELRIHGDRKNEELYMYVVLALCMAFDFVRL